MKRGPLWNFDIRNTRLRYLDLRMPDASLMVDARGTKITIRVDDPKQMALDWQTTIDAGVRIIR